MGTLHLVRHAQAAFFADDYDSLSELGRDQARRLGEHWARAGLRLDVVASGPRRRQIETAEIAAEAFRRAAGGWPDLEVVEALDEYRLDLRRDLAALASGDAFPRAAELVRAMGDASDPVAMKKAFQRALEAMLEHWAAGELSPEGAESFAEFCDRVESGYAHLVAGGGKGREIAAFSSAGTIGVLVGRVVGGPPRALLELGWALENCSVSVVRFSGDRRSLGSFNVVEHLPSTDLRSYR